MASDTVSLASGCDAVCVFVDAVLDRQVLELLTEHGKELAALRSAGLAHVDLRAAEEFGIRVRVPAYSF